MVARIVWHRCSLRAAGVKTNELNVKSRKSNMVRIVPNLRDKFLKITIKKFRLWKKQLYDHRYQQIVISWWSWEDKHCSCRSKTETQRYLCFQFRYVRRFWKSQNSNAPLQFLIITNPWQWWLLFVGFYSSLGDPRFLKLWQILIEPCERLSYFILLSQQQLEKHCSFAVIEILVLLNRSQFSLGVWCG